MGKFGRKDKVPVITDAKSAKKNRRTMRDRYNDVVQPVFYTCPKCHDSYPKGKSCKCSR